MKKKLISMLLCTVMISSLLQGCGNQTEVQEQQNVRETTEKEDVMDTESEVAEVTEITLPVAEATVTGQGINADGESVDTAYVPDFNAVTNFGTESTIDYIIPEGVDGDYDIYLNISKSPYAYGTTPVSIIVNNQDEYVYPAAIVSCSQDYSDLFDMGTFLMAEKITLKSGDTLTVHGKPGFELEWGGKKVSSMSSIGDIYLYQTDAEVAVGYDGGIVPAQEETNASDPISGKTIVWLGSSVTYGNGYSMADVIEENHANTTCLKYAISGTTLVNENESSYVERLRDINANSKMDLLVVQLSTNDATQGKKMGTLADGTDMTEFDDTTIIGAMETIIAYAKETWNCPVVFYTGTYFESEEYDQMVDALLEVQNKWDIGVVNLWDDEEMTAVCGTDAYTTYMKEDGIHPTSEGYKEWWTPKFEEYLSEYFSK